ncbi:NAD(P)-binding protein [Cutaneotrichosporon oleaginosum]|uniref:2,4-dienoyl-CoA reductase [(3E)-enoyl-CoA-producing] n=1 Tax=Cutaneotrichosporon oleaginosum TaxID=879819 RepID=A0A0J0XXJ7_9TREE|nr:NAD(P)-binding protein [Cutaneotrichosporon oleaginosum]KLT45787.1 NAD(P)-binding protein [Cutaneotrichosporon oleaginosum]TXT04450.1 hypothetical protein COLE_07269 [Cutaneotrichosporon oleaginosum]
MASIFQPGIYKGKVLFITGGRSGIGYSIAEEMMRFGASACILGRDAKGLQESAAALEKSTGSKCLAAPADVRSKEDLAKAVKACLDKFGRIDFVVCAAAGNFLAPISGMSENAFRTVIEIDTIGTYNTLKATLPAVRETKGAYLHISATLHYAGTPYQAHVSAAKAAIDALSNVIAVEEGPRGVRSNVCAPGPIANTEGMKRLGTKGREIERGIPLGKQGDTTDIAYYALWLFSPAAAWVTGSTMVIDGGQMHIRGTSLPYPESVLDPESVKELYKGKL